MYIDYVCETPGPMLLDSMRYALINMYLTCAAKTII